MNNLPVIAQLIQSWDFNQHLSDPQTHRENVQEGRAGWLRPILRDPLVCMEF